ASITSRELLRFLVAQRVNCRAIKLGVQRMTQQRGAFVPVGKFPFGQYYKHSGQINVPGLLSALVGGVIAGAILGAVYAAAVIFIPFIKLTILICLFYGIALGAVPGFLLQKFKVRNLPISLGVVLLVTVVSFYLSWASWEAIVCRNAEEFPSIG